MAGVIGTFDVIVVGAGPAGGTAAILLAEVGRSVAIVDPLGIGGALINLEWVPDHPDHPGGIAGWDLAAELGERVLDAGVELILGTVDAVRADGVEIDGGPRHSRAVLLATGRRPNVLPGAEGLEGRGVSYCAACDGGMFAGQEVIVVGGGHEALAEAKTLAALASKVTVLCPEPSLAADAYWQAALAAEPNVEIIPGATVRQVTAATVVTGVDFERGGALAHLAAAGVFGGLPGIPAAELLIARDGLFSAGDIRPDAPRRIAAAIADARAVAADIDAWLG